MDPDLMTDEELAERDRVLITCTGCGQTYGYAIATIAQQQEDVMNATQNQTAADVIAHWLWSTEGINEVPTSTVISDAEELIAALANAGYTIAGPGHEVVPVEVADAAQKALMEAPTRFAGREGERRRICTDWRFARKTDPLPTQEGE